MDILDYERRLHQVGNDYVDYTAVKEDETAIWRYTALTSLDDLLFVRELISGDETITEYAIFLNRADEIENLWVLRALVYYTRIDLTSDSSSNTLFYQFFENTDGSGAVGGVSQDPADIAYLEIVGGNNYLSGVVAVPAGSGSDYELISTIDVAMTKQVNIGVGMTYLLSVNFLPLVFSVCDSNDECIFEIVLFRFNANHTVVIRDKLGTDSPAIYSGVEWPDPTRFLCLLDLEATTPNVTITSPSITLIDNVEIDISAGGAMTSTDVKYLKCGISGSGDPSDGRGYRFQNLFASNAWSELE